MMTFKLNINNLNVSRFLKYKSLTLFFTTLLVSLTTSVYAEDKNLDGIAAIVNSDVIMVSELRTAAQQFQSSKANQGTQKDIYKTVLEKLILDKIQVQKAKAIGIKIDDAAVDTAMQSIAKQNNLDLQQLRLAIIKRGLNYKVFRESIRDRLYSDNLRNRQIRSSNIEDNDVDDLIQAESFNLSQNVQYQLIDIVIPNKNNSVQQFNVNLQRAQNIRNKLLLNKNLSGDVIKKMGGTMKEIGWQNAEALSPIFSRTLSLMGEGELSNVVRDPQGFHILKLLKQRGGKRQEILEVKVRHILINNDKPQAKLKVTQIRNKILAGESFAKLAAINSDDTGSAKNGGELPITSTTNYVPPFANAVNNLALNTLSQPVQTKFGWHIIEVLEKRKSDKTSESIKNQAKQFVSIKKQDESMKNWLKSLREEAFVEYRINL